jgi:STE24 endopeptidase
MPLEPHQWTVAAALTLILAKVSMQWLLEALNQAHVRRHATRIPDAFVSIIDEPTYRKSVDYTLAKSRLNVISILWNLVLLLAVLFSGVLPVAWSWTQQAFGTQAWSAAGFLFAVGVALAVADLPLEWYSQFHLEQRFGFNNTTPRLWWLDRLKGFGLSFLLGYPLLALVLKFFDWAGSAWWLWAWAAFMAFQLLLAVLAPVLIMPLFNKFTPLPDGELKDRLLQLAERTRFRARAIQVMDGSRRSQHSNAFFTGFGRFRKVVLFDTLVRQLTIPELEAVLAHEIGHYRRRHILKMLIGSALGLLGMFFCAAWLVEQPWFYRAFGFASGHPAPALLLFGLLAGTFSFWLSPVTHLVSRKFEYEADAFAAAEIGGAAEMVNALRKLHEKNLSNLTPHPLYSGFYYSHPAMLERERALAKAAA